MAGVGWVTAAWDVTENKRRAPYDTVTAAGRRRLAEEESHWRTLTSAVGRVLRHA